MRRRFATLGTTTTCVLVAAVVVAGPAGARNLGGNGPRDGTCITPGRAEIHSPNSGLPCICVVLPNGSVVRNVGKGPDTACPPGIAR